MPGLDTTGLQQATGLAQGQALKIIGGVPILKNLSGSTLERLKLPKHVDIGNVGDILAAVASGGPGALLQNPIGAAQTALDGAISSAAASLTSALGGAAASLTGALGGLSTSATSLSQLAGNLAGVTNIAGVANSFDLMGHLGLAQGFGGALPAALGLDKVVAPLTASTALAGFQGQITSIASQVIGGTMSVSAGTAAVNAIKGQIDGMVSGSTGAIQTLQDAAPAMAAASVAIALLVPGQPGIPSDLQDAMTAAIRPDMLATVQGIVDAHVADVTGGP